MFKRSRDTLTMKLSIPLRAALLGFETRCAASPPSPPLPCSPTAGRLAPPPPPATRTHLAPPLPSSTSTLPPSFKHLDGHTVTVKRTGVTKPGQTIRIKGEGMPKHGTPAA